MYIMGGGRIFVRGLGATTLWRAVVVSCRQNFVRRLFLVQICKIYIIYILCKGRGLKKRSSPIFLSLFNESYRP